MKITVLYGGPSAEREVSLVSGRAVIDGLKKAGHDVFASDISPDDLSGLDRPADRGKTAACRRRLDRRSWHRVGNVTRSDTGKAW